MWCVLGSRSFLPSLYIYMIISRHRIQLVCVIPCVTLRMCCRSMLSWMRPSCRALDTKLENQTTGIQYFRWGEQTFSYTFLSSGVMNPAGEQTNTSWIIVLSECCRVLFTIPKTKSFIAKILKFICIFAKVPFISLGCKTDLCCQIMLCCRVLTPCKAKRIEIRSALLQLSKFCSNWPITTNPRGQISSYRKEDKQPGRLWTPTDFYCLMDGSHSSVHMLCSAEHQFAGLNTLPNTLTCLDHMLHGWEALADSRADWAEDEEWCQVNITYQRPAQQAAIFIFTLNTAGAEGGWHTSHTVSTILCP